MSITRWIDKQIVEYPYMSLINLLPLSFKCTLQYILCNKHFFKYSSFYTRTMLNFLSRGQWRGTKVERGSPTISCRDMGVKRFWMSGCEDLRQNVVPATCWEHSPLSATLQSQPGNKLPTSLLIWKPELLCTPKLLHTLNASARAYFLSANPHLD